jgi:hypothetical protein
VGGNLPEVAGYNLYVLLCVVGNLTHRCWLYSVCTAVGMCLPEVAGFNVYVLLCVVVNLTGSCCL